MDTLDQQIELDSDKLRINNSIKENLITAGKWARFLSIIGFIFTGIIGIFALVVLISSMATGYGGLFLLMGVGYLVASVIMVFPSLYLIRYAISIEKGLNSNKQGEFDYAVQNMKSFFKFMGIYTIVVIGLYLLMILFSIIGKTAL
jgi:hypothetical protein